MRRMFGWASGLAMMAVAATATAAPIELITNGNFETGTFGGWTTTVLGGSNGNLFIDTPGTTTPQSGMPTVGTGANGSWYAVSDQGGAGTYALSQAFTLGASSSVILRFDMFANDWDTGPLCVTGLNHTAGPAQCARVDILSTGAGAFDTGAGVLANYFVGVDGGPDPHGFTSYLFDITALVGGGGTFILRFAEVDNQFFFNMGVDNVSIQAEAVPEPASLTLLGLGLVAGARRLRRKVS